MSVLEYQFALFAFHDNFHSTVLGVYFLSISVPGDLRIVGLHIDLELAPVVLHHTLALELGGEGVGILFYLQPAVRLVLLPVLDELRYLDAVSPGVVQLAHLEDQAQLLRLINTLDSAVRGELEQVQFIPKHVQFKPKHVQLIPKHVHFTPENVQFIPKHAKFLQKMYSLHQKMYTLM